MHHDDLQCDATEFVLQDTHITTPEAARYNSGKTEYHLVPREWYDALAEVLNAGAKKYAPNNWKKGGPNKVCANSLERHLLAWKSGESIDPDDGISHLHKIAANALMLAYYEKHGLVTDDFRRASE